MSKQSHKCDFIKKIKEKIDYKDGGKGRKVRDITISVSEDEYHTLQAYALYLRKQEQELYSNTAREASDDWMVEDVVMLGIRDRMAIFRMMQEVG